MFKHLILMFDLFIRLRIKNDIQTLLNARMIIYRKLKRICKHKFFVVYDFI